MVIYKVKKGFLLIELLISLGAFILLSATICSVIGMVAQWSHTAHERMRVLLVAQQLVDEQLHTLDKPSIAIECTVNESELRIPDFYSPEKSVHIKHVTVKSDKNKQFYLCSGKVREEA